MNSNEKLSSKTQQQEIAEEIENTLNNDIEKVNAIGDDDKRILQLREDNITTETLIAISGLLTTKEANVRKNTNSPYKKVENVISPCNDNITDATSSYLSIAEEVSSHSTKSITENSNQNQTAELYRQSNENIYQKTDGIASSSLQYEATTVIVSPSMVRKTSDVTTSTSRRVSFPKSDNELVTGYLEPANPWVHALVKNSSEIVKLYLSSCQKHGTKPLQTILDHLKTVELNTQLRQPLLSLRAIPLSSDDCEALEEIFKNVQYKCIDISSCELDETSISALFGMMEYYEATNELDISSNSKGMTSRGWTSCSYMVRHSQSLYILNAQGNPISKPSAESLGQALNTSNLHTLKLEHCGLRGMPFNGLCYKLRGNRVIKELWLAYNDLDCHDADILGDLLKVNHYLELVDISNNNIRDEGLMYIVKALIIQSRELERRSMLHRSAAIDDDDVLSPLETTTREELITNSTTSSSGNSDANQKATITCFGCSNNNEKNMESITDLGNKMENQEKLSVESISVTGMSTEENDVDEDSENTVKSSNSKELPQIAGQSMLDKLLSMNSDSSSDDGASNFSSDTIAACSEDTSIISDDIFVPSVFGANISSNKKISMSTGTSTTFPVTVNNEILAELITHQTQKDESYLKEISSIVHNVENNNTNSNDTMCAMQHVKSSEGGLENDTIFEVTAEESDCLISCASGEQISEQHSLLLEHSTKTFDLNKNTKLGEDFDDTHSTDSAFESASEGDISRHLPEEFCRLSSSFESTRLDDMTREVIETATIATESTECLLDVASTPTGTTACTSLEEMVTELVKDTKIYCVPTIKEIENPVKEIQKLSIDDVAEVLPITNEINEALDEQVITEAKENNSTALPKVTIDEESLSLKCKHFKSSPNPTPPPPPMSPGGAGLGMRRTESSCAFISQSTRNFSQSSDSLCSDNSFDGSINSDSNMCGSAHLNERLTKNDTLTRQQRQSDLSGETVAKSPGGLKVLALWNNNLTKDAGIHIADLLAETSSLELLNIGKNCLSNDFVSSIKESLTRNTLLTTLGLQSAHLSSKGIEILSSILTFGGNNTLQRIDIRDNKLEVESLTTIAETLKSNTTITQIDIDDEPKRLSVGSDAHLDYTRVLENVRSMCSRNEKIQTQISNEKTCSNIPSVNKHSGGYYLGSRKISLTCHSRPLIDTIVGSSVGLTPICKLDVKRKPGARLRSPIPSPPTGSPSSSPSRSRFQVYRVTEVSPLSSPLNQTPPLHPPFTTTLLPSNSVAIPSVSSTNHILQSTSLPTSSSLPSMTTVTSSTQSTKRKKISPCSRFHVFKVYEDPQVPLSSRLLPPITPPQNVSLPSTSHMNIASQNKNDSKPIDTGENASINTLINSAVETACQNSTNIVNDSTTLSSLRSSSSSSPSSSSSTSPASTSSTSSSSTPLASNSDDSQSLKCHMAELSSSSRCPIAVFNDNDITLTKNSFNNILYCASVSSTPSANEEFIKSDLGDNRETAKVHIPQRTRKFSNSAVDKFLNLFQSSTNMLQRSLSPEPKTIGTTLSSHSMQNDDARQQEPLQNVLAVSHEYTSNSWSKLSTDILNGSRAENVNTIVSAAAATTSFLDAKTKQLRDLVLRPNLSSGNELNLSVSSIADETAERDNLTIKHDAAVIPTDIKQDVKENVTPEQKISEEMFQKSCVADEFSATNNSGMLSLETDIKDLSQNNRIVENTINMATLTASTAEAQANQQTTKRNK